MYCIKGIRFVLTLAEVSCVRFPRPNAIRGRSYVSKLCSGAMKASRQMYLRIGTQFLLRLFAARFPLARSFSPDTGSNRFNLIIFQLIPSGDGWPFPGIIPFRTGRPERSGFRLFDVSSGNWFWWWVSVNGQSNETHQMYLLDNDFRLEISHCTLVEFAWFFYTVYKFNLDSIRFFCND